MTYKTQHTYSVPAAYLYSLLTDAEFLRDKYQSAGSRDVLFRECGHDGEVFRIEWSRKMASNPPAFARQVLSDWNWLEEVVEWSLEPDGSYHADYLGQVKGAPGELRGAFELRDQDGGCLRHIVLQASIPVPLLGKRIAAFAEEEAARNVAAEHEFVREYLSQPSQVGTN